MASSQSRAREVAAWVGTAATAAAIGALGAGAYEAIGAGGAVAGVGTIGYSALLVWPALTVLALVARGLWRGWAPGRIAAALVEDTGGAPRLAAWAGYAALACWLLTFATFNLIYWLKRNTAFTPEVISLVVPVAVTMVAGLLVVGSRPAVVVIAAGLRRLDRWLVARLGRTPFRPRTIAIAMVVALVALIVVWWKVSVAPRVYVDVGILVHPVIAVGLTLGWHALAPRLSWRRRQIAAAAAGALVALAIGCALWLRVARPTETLRIWARPTVASEVIARIYELEDVRDDIEFLVPPPVARPGATPRDVLLITIDTVRADQTPVGGGQAEMPVLRQLAETGATFTSAYAPGNVTRRSVPTIATGVSPTRLRGKVTGWGYTLDPRHIVLAERFYAAGYQTAGFFCCHAFWGPHLRLGLNRGLDHLVIEPDGADIARVAAGWLGEQRSTGPRFVWIHFIEPHNWTKGASLPRSVPERRTMYGGVLSKVDGYMGTIVEAFRAAGRDPIIAVTADHGESFGEHGQLYHSTDLYDTQIHVPLVIAGPGVVAHAVVEPVGLVGLAPTLMELAGFVPPGMPEMDGTSFATLASTSSPGEPTGGFAYAVMMRDRFVAYASRAVIKGTWKLIDGPKGVELYDRSTDRGEARNLAKVRLDKLREMQDLLAARRALDARSPFASQ